MRGSTTFSPLVQSMKPVNPHVHLKNTVVSSSLMHPLLKFQNFPDTSICLSVQISLVFCRRGNPMELIDDCTVSFFDILPHTLLSTGKRSHAPVLELSLTTTIPCTQTQLMTKPKLYSSQLVVIGEGPGRIPTISVLISTLFTRACQQFCSLHDPTEHNDYGAKYES
jgi:hypothetical protein